MHRKLPIVDKHQVSLFRKSIKSLQPESLLEKLIRIPSQSGDEYRASCFLETYLKKHGVQVRRQRVGKRRFNIIASIGSRTHGPRILFNTHIDTVPTFTKQALQPTLRGGVLYGRGTCDAKGSVAAMTTAFLTLARLSPQEQPRVTLAIMVGEENSGDGVARFTRNSCDFHWAIVGEPTGLNVAHTQSGYLELEIQARSAPCHGFDPKNQQAAVALSALIHACSNLADNLSKHYSHSLFVRSMMSGSEDSFWYTRPTACARILINTYPDGTQTKTLRRMRLLAREIEKCHPGTRLRLTITDADNGLTTSPNGKSVHALCAGLAAVGMKTRSLHLPSWTDGSTLSEMGIETVIFGPGDLRDAHSNTECVRLADVSKAALVLALSCKPSVLKK